MALRVCQLAGAEAHFSQALAMAGGGLSAGAASCPSLAALPAASVGLIWRSSIGEAADGMQLTHAR